MNRIAVKLCSCLKSNLPPTQFRPIHLNVCAILCRKYDLDYSKVPKLDEAELKEQFVNGWGPGGQSVNKTMNCVVLIHKPLGITVKCHATRSLERNRKIARELMVQKMDDLLNGDDSIENQKKKIDEGKNRSLEAKRKKREALKLEWKKTEELDKVNDN